MTDHANNSISTVEDVIEYLFTSLRNMRAHQIENEFQEGYERAFNDVMYHLSASASCAATENCGHDGTQ